MTPTEFSDAIVAALRAAGIAAEHATSGRHIRIVVGGRVVASWTATRTLSGITITDQRGSRLLSSEAAAAAAADITAEVNHDA